MKLNKQSRLNYFLGLLQEESAEIIQITNKIKRFGLDEHYHKEEFNNITRLQHEVKDLLTVIKMIETCYDIDLGLRVFDEIYTIKKIQKINKYMKYSEELGLVETTKEE